jgi:hypothetical protein
MIGVFSVGESAVGDITSSSSTNNLTAASITTGQPLLGAPSIDGSSGVDALIALGFDSGVASLGSPAIGQTHSIFASAVTAGTPLLGAPSLGGPIAIVLGSLRGSIKQSYPRRPSIDRSGRRY